jgi:hypothetical protein
LGYDIISKGRSVEIDNLRNNVSESILKDNFKEICNSYEFLFSKYFGEIIKNPERLYFMQRLIGTGPSEAYFIINSLEKTKNVDGDICEFGVAQGETSSLIANEIKSTKKLFHLFDSFEGLPKPTEKDILKNDIFNLGSIDAYEGTMKCHEQMVLERMKQLDFPEERYFIHKGFIERLIIKKENFPNKISFSYLDFDFYEPTKIVLNFLDENMEKDSIIIVDDYDSFSTGAKSAVDEFILEKNKMGKKYEIVIPDKVFGCFVILTKI